MLGKRWNNYTWHSAITESTVSHFMSSGIGRIFCAIMFYILIILFCFVPIAVHRYPARSIHRYLRPISGHQHCAIDIVPALFHAVGLDSCPTTDDLLPPLSLRRCWRSENNHSNRDHCLPLFRNLPYHQRCATTSINTVKSTHGFLSPFPCVAVTTNIIIIIVILFHYHNHDKCPPPLYFSPCCSPTCFPFYYQPPISQYTTRYAQ